MEVFLIFFPQISSHTEGNVYTNNCDIKFLSSESHRGLKVGRDHLQVDVKHVALCRRQSALSTESAERSGDDSSQHGTEEMFRRHQFLRNIYDCDIQLRDPPCWQQRDLNVSLWTVTFQRKLSESSSLFNKQWSLFVKDLPATRRQELLPANGVKGPHDKEQMWQILFSL